MSNKINSAQERAELFNGGKVLAVGDPGASAVRLFDKDGSKWVQCGEESLRCVLNLRKSVLNQGGKNPTNGTRYEL